LPNLIEGTVESLNGSGIFTGWLRDTDDPAPVIVEIRHAGETCARSVAAAFRPDLLRGLHGHGHYGFQAQLLRVLPPGRALFELFLPRHRQGVRASLIVPPVTLSQTNTVETLLAPGASWTVSDLLANIGCLGLAGHKAAMGNARFIDAAFRFALCRWPSKAEAQVYAQALDSPLESGGLTADDMLRELLTSRERQDVEAPLASPWDSAFPFVTRSSGSKMAAS
jgi:hypothetical protein